MFKEAADIQTADMLNLPVPEAHYHNIVVEAVGNRKRKWWRPLQNEPSVSAMEMVDSSVDNMLHITNDGRKLGLGSAAHERYAPRQRDKQGQRLCEECL